MKKVLLFSLMLCGGVVFGQVSVGSATPDASAQLDVVATNKGMLVPRVALTNSTDIATIASPAISLLVYNTATAGDVVPGFHYWDGAKWQQITNKEALQAASDLTKDAWVDNISDARIELGTKADGTTARDAGTEVVITDSGNLGIGTEAPTSSLVVASEAGTNALLIQNKDNTAAKVEVNNAGNAIFKIGKSDVYRVVLDQGLEAEESVGLWSSIEAGANHSEDQANAVEALSAITTDNSSVVVGSGLVGVLEIQEGNSTAMTAMRGTFSESRYRGSGSVKDLDGGVFVAGAREGASGSVTNMSGVRGRTILRDSNTSSTVQNLSGVVSSNNILSGFVGTVENSYRFRGRRGFNTPGKITNEYGLYLEDVNKGTTENYAIYTNGGDVRFGDNVGIGTTTSPTEKLEVNGTIKATDINFTGLPVFADEAAATAGGLSTGDCYRTATGELRIKL